MHADTDRGKPAARVGAARKSAPRSLVAVCIDRRRRLRSTWRVMFVRVGNRGRRVAGRKRLGNRFVQRRFPNLPLFFRRVVMVAPGCRLADLFAFGTVGRRRP